MANLAVANVPGHVDTQPLAELDRSICEVTLPQVVANLTGVQPEVVAEEDPGPRTVVFSGSFEAVQERFVAERWSDGLPVIPPTVPAVEAFLAHTPFDPDHSFGPLLPDSRAATVWSVAVNGVMAGCRPEYMPVLTAVAACLADPAYGVEVVTSPDVIDFYQRATAFYERLHGRRFNSIATFRDAGLREYFQTEQSFSDYYADLADHLDRPHALAIEAQRSTQRDLDAFGPGEGLA